MSGVRGGWCVDRGGRLRFIKVATQIAPPDRALARSRPRGGRGSFRRRAAHQARIGPCGASLVGIRTAGNRPMSTNWRHAPRPAAHAIFGLRAVRRRVEACAPGRVMAPIRAHRTIPGCPDAYKRCSARPYPHPAREDRRLWAPERLPDSSSSPDSGRSRISS